MVNTNIQGPIAVEGSVGYRSRRYNKYVPGEFTQCENVVMYNSMLVNRPGVVGVLTDNTGAWNNTTLVTKNYGEYHVLAGPSVHKLIAPSTNINLWDSTLLAADEEIAGHFKYNDKFYWLTQTYTVTNLGGGSIKVDTTIKLYEGASYNTAFGALTSTTLVTVSVTLPNSETDVSTKLLDYMIFKDRLWLLTQGRVYYSSPTDPKDFTAPEGGFVDLPDVRFKSFVGLSDSVYIGHTKGCHVLNFYSDPAVDGSFRSIYAETVVRALELHRDTIYFLSNRGFGVVSNQSFSEIFTVKDVGEELVSMTHLRSSPLGVFIFYGKNWCVDAYKDNGADALLYQPEYNFLSVYSIQDSRGVAVDQTNFGDILTYVQESSFGDNRMLIVAAYDADTFRLVESRPYFNDAASRLGLDQLYGDPTSGDLEYYRIKTVLELYSYVPDGSEHMMKKFRRLQVMGELPLSNFTVKFGLDNLAYGAAVSITNSDSNDGLRPPHPFVISINKRARALSIKLEYSDYKPVVTFDTDDIFRLLIEDLRVLWTYTQRGAVTSKPASSL